MRINALELFNFRNIEDSRISFEDKKFVVLIGDNGSGKTALLESITKVFAPILRTVNQEAMKECDLTNTDIMYGMTGTAIAAKITLDGEGYSWMNKRRNSSIEPFDKRIEKKDKEYSDSKKLKAKYAECLSRNQLPLVLYYGTDRILRGIPQRGHIKNFEIKDALKNYFDNTNYFRDFYDWFKTEEDIELRNLRQNSHCRNPRLDCVRTALERMIKGYSNLRIELSPSRMVMTNAAGIDLQIDQLSGGYKAVLSVTADIAKRLAQANPVSDNPLEEEAVILIDELDLHLHPKWQKSIVEDLKRTFPNCQFIVSTHSPFIIQSLNADELFDISEMKYADEAGSYNGWSIEEIQEAKMGVEARTPKFCNLLQQFTNAVDEEELGNARRLYEQLVRMAHPESYERKVLDMDMEMIAVDDKID